MNKSKNTWSEFNFTPSENTADGSVSTDASWILTLNVAGRGKLVTALKFLKTIGETGKIVRNTLAILLAHAASQGSTASIYSLRTGALTLVKYLKHCRSQKLLKSYSPQQISTSILTGYASWLSSPQAPIQRAGLSLRSEYSRGMLLIRNAAQIHPQMFSSEMLIPTNPFSHKKLVGQKRNQRTLSEADFNEIKSRTRQLVAERISTTPKSHPQRDDLWAFYFYILIETVGNAVPIAEISRKCIQQHSVEQDYLIVTWTKRRSKSVHYQMVRKEEESPNLATAIDYLIRWTEPLARRAHQAIQDRLFLYESKRGGVRAIRFDMAVHLNGKSSHPNQWFSSTYRTPPFRVRQLRETQALLHYSAGKSILDVRDMLQHGSLDSTKFYLTTRTAKIERDTRVSTAQKEIYRALSTPPQEVYDLPIKQAARRLKTSQEAKLRILSGEQEVGLNGCKNPWDSPFMNKKGKLCTYHSACLDCQNAFFVKEHLPVLIAERRVLLKKRASMSEVDWAAGPEITVEKLTSKIAQFSKNSIEEAEKDADAAETLVLAKLKGHIINH